LDKTAGLPFRAEVSPIFVYPIQKFIGQQ